MQNASFRRAKKTDFYIQLVVFVLTVAYGGVQGSLLFGLLLCLITIGFVQVISWLAWLFATPRRHWNTGRVIYTIALALVGAGFALDRFRPSDRDSVFTGLMVVSAFMAVAYAILTLTESRPVAESP